MTTVAYSKNILLVRKMGVVVELRALRYVLKQADVSAKLKKFVQYVLRPKEFIDLLKYVRQYDKTKSLKLGIIAHWMFVSIDETRWFIDDVFKKLRSIYPGMELIIAGRGDEKMARHYFRGEGVRFIGEVESLDDFFNNINIYVATVPKGCGVLNKLLDAFSYRVFSIGVEASFSAFTELKEGYLMCDTIEDYVNAIQMYRDNQEQIHRMVENAYEYISQFHTDEEKNYKEVIDVIENMLISK